MKLNFPQRITVVFCLFWILGCVGAVVNGEKDFFPMLISATVVPVIALWLTGGLKPVFSWLLKGSHEAN